MANILPTKEELDEYVGGVIPEPKTPGEAITAALKDTI